MMKTLINISQSYIMYRCLITGRNNDSDVRRLSLCRDWMAKKAHFYLILFVVFLFGNSLCIASAKAEFVISPTGNDHNPGTIDKPFASFERARDAIRELKQKAGLPVDGVMVSIRGGTYSLSK